MTQKIQIRRSNITTLPTASNLVEGELGYTEVAGVHRLFIGKFGIGAGVVEIGGDNFALLNSPTFTGIPAAPTAIVGTNTTQIATTSFVANAIANTSLASGNIFVGNVSNIATSVAMSGDATISNTGVLTIKNDVALAGNPTTTTQTPTDSSTRIATTAFVQAAVQAAQAGLSAKASALAATTGILPTVTAGGSGIGKTLTATTNGVLIVDGVNTWYDVNTDGGSTNPDDPINRAASRVLVKNQTNAADNGIYTVTQKGSAGTPFILTRSLDADTGTNLTSGSFIFIESGTINANAGFVLSTLDPITIDTTSLTFVQFSGAGAITAGDGLIKSGNIISALSDITTVNANIANSVNVSANGLAVKIDGSTIDTNGSSQLRVKPGSITTTQISATAGITGGQIASGTITASNIASGTITASLISLTNGNILVGNASNIAASVSVSGDATISNTGVLTIANNAITAAKIATSIVSSTGGLVGGGGTALAIKPDVTTGATVCPITIGANGAGVTVDNSSIIQTSGTISVNIVDGGTF